MRSIIDKEILNSAESRQIDNIVHEIESKYSDHPKSMRTECPCCSSDNYNYAFKKLSFHYVECTKCHTLYIQNSLNEEILNAITQELNILLSNNKSIEKILEKSDESILYNFDLFLNRIFDLKNEKIKVGYIGSKKELYSKEMSKYPNILLEEFNKTSIYDVIIINNSIEKSFSPSKLMSSIKKSLHQGGYIYLTTRVSDGIDILTLWEDSNISPVEHINLLSIDGLKKYMLKGFAIKDLSTPGSMDVEFIINSTSKNIPKFITYMKQNSNNDALVDFQHFIQKNLLSSYLLLFAKLEE